jgi:DNA-binding beta-propeller fold protein YncE
MKKQFTILIALAACGDGDEPACSDVSGTACTWSGKVGVTGTDPKALTRHDALYYFPADITFDKNGAAWIPDWNNHLVRRIDPDGSFHTVMGDDYEGDGSPGETDRLPEGNPEGAPALEVALNHPMDIDFLPDGRMVLAAWHNNKVRMMDPSTGIATVLAGNSYGYKGDGGPAYNAVFNLVPSVVCAPDGTTYMIDQRNLRVRKITNEAVPMISTFAGTGVKGSTGDGGLATDAQLGFHTGNTPLPSGSLAIDPGNEYLYISNSFNNSIRRVSFATNIIECVAGCTAAGAPGFDGDGGSAKAALLDYPHDLEFGPDGRLYVVDQNNNRVRAIDLANDTITTVAGNGSPCGLGQFCVEDKEGLPALEVTLNTPYGIGFDAEGSMYIADTSNSRIVRIAK